jgi:hypothetical protein
MPWATMFFTWLWHLVVHLVQRGNAVVYRMSLPQWPQKTALGRWPAVAAVATNTVALSSGRSGHKHSGAVNDASCQCWSTCIVADASGGASCQYSWSTCYPNPLPELLHAGGTRPRIAAARPEWVTGLVRRQLSRRWPCLGGQVIALLGWPGDSPAWMAR